MCVAGLRRADNGNLRREDSSPDSTSRDAPDAPRRTGSLDGAPRASSGAPHNVPERARLTLLNTHALLLTYELQTRQLELEIQNEQLHASQRELARAKDTLADLYEHAPVGYVTSTHEGVVLSANLSFAALVDAERDSLVGRPLSDWVARDDQDAYHHHRGQLQAGAGQQSCELRMLRASGETFWGALESAVIDAADGTAEVRSAVVDITQRKRAEQEERQLKERLEQSQKMEAIGALAGRVAHDVNNILAVILALGCRLERDLPKNQGSCQDVRDIVAAVFRGKKLIQDLLDFARRGSRGKEGCAPHDVVEGLVSVLERAAPQRDNIGLDEEDNDLSRCATGRPGAGQAAGDDLPVEVETGVGRAKLGAAAENENPWARGIAP